MSSVELEQQLNKASSELLELIQVPTEYSKEAPNNLDIEQHVIDTLWVIKAGFQEVNALADIGTDSALFTLETLERKSEEFCRIYQGTLLANDIRKQLLALKGDLTNQLLDQWHSNVNFIDENEQTTIKISSTAPVDSVASHAPRELDRTLHHIAKVVEKLASLRCSEVKIDDDGQTITVIYSEADLRKSLNAISLFVAALDETPLKSRIARRFSQQLYINLIPALRLRLPVSREDLSQFPVKDIEDLEIVLRKHNWARGDDLSHFTTGIEGEWRLCRQNSYLCALRDILKGSYSPEKHAWLSDKAQVESAEPKDDWDWDDDDDNDDNDNSNNNNHNDDGDNSVHPNQSERFTSPFDVYESAKNELGELHGFTALFKALAPDFYGKNKIALYRDARRLVENGDIDLAPFGQSVFHSLVTGYENELIQLVNSFVLRDEKAISPEKTSKLCEWFVQTGASLDSDLRAAVMSQLGELLVTTVISDIESLPDIAEPHSAALVRTINGLEGIAPAFPNYNVADEVPSWLKLQGLKHVLNGNLHDIKGLWEAGQLLDFEPTELHNLLRALFVDSSRLSALLAEIH